jgi:two-component sensor histidine kinase
MALVHERLYRSKDFAHIDFEGYTRQLGKELFQAYEIESGNITLETAIENVYVNINQAVPCGLIINELLSNALKYAFPSDRTGKVIVALKPHENGMFELSVCDDGIGISDEVDLTTGKTTGMAIVNALVRQLRAEIAIDRSKGTCFHIRFKRK